MPEYRTTLCLSFFYKFFLQVRQDVKGDVDKLHLSALDIFYPEGLPTGTTLSFN